jgi:hypothetical protein
MSAMQFEWDAAKATANLAKHGLAFSVAVRVFADPHRLTVSDARQDYGEARHNTVGQIETLAVVCVTHTDRAGIVRLISARPASRKERNHYYVARKNTP